MDATPSLPTTIDDLQPAAYNPRTIADAAAAGLAKSISNYGDISGIVWNKRTGNLVAGHQRVEQIRKLGGQMFGASQVGGQAYKPYLRVGKDGEHFPVRVVDWTEATEKAANIAANNPHIAGSFTDGLVGLLEEVKASMSEEDFTELRLEELTASLGDLFPSEDATEVNEDEPPEPSTGSPVAKLGDVWQLGEHRLMCGDSADAAVVARLFADCEGKAYLMATDPPYGVAYDGKNQIRDPKWEGIQNDNMDGETMRQWLEGLLNTWFPFTNGEAAFYLWAPPDDRPFRTAIENVGLNMQSEIIWKKNLVMGRCDYHWAHEHALYAFWKGKQHRWLGERNKTTVWEMNRVPSSEYLHPMQKPVELYAIPIRHHTHEGEIVAEPFAGSGTQVIAAEQLNRICYAMEIEPKFCDVIIERWQNLTSGQAKRIA